MLNILTAVTADESYPRYLTVMLYSLFINNPENEIKVYILHDGLSEEFIQNIKNCEKSDQWMNNKYIIPILVDKYLFEDADTAGFSVGTYFRLLMFDLLPPSIDRLLYLDVDLIVNDSLQELYSINLNGNLIAACSHGFKKEDLVKGVRAGIIQPKKGECFNAGVVLYDFSRMRSDYHFSSFKKLIEDKEIFYDQGILNYLFWDKTEYVPTEIYNNRGMNHSANIEDSVIIHYADANPWEMLFTRDDLELLKKYDVLSGKRVDCLNEYYMDMVSVWWKYSQNSVYHNEFIREAEVMHRYFMDRIVRTYFEKMEKEHRLMIFKEKLLEQTINESLVRKIKANNSSGQCIIYGMGYFGRLISKYLNNYMWIPFYIDREKKDNTDLEYRSIEQLNGYKAPVLVCV